jgi:serine/threonine-protein kinase
MAAVPKINRTGQVLVDTYRIERLLAEGGMGSVYEARHLRLPKRFAIKFLNLNLLNSAEALARFRREAEIIATLDHPNIVSLLDYNVTDDGVPFIVLEFLDGEHLAKRIARGKLPLDEALRIVAPVVHALSRRMSAASSTATSSRRTSSSAVARW